MDRTSSSSATASDRDMVIEVERQEEGRRDFLCFFKMCRTRTCSSAEEVAVVVAVADDDLRRSFLFSSVVSLVLVGVVASRGFLTLGEVRVFKLEGVVEEAGRGDLFNIGFRSSPISESNFAVKPVVNCGGTTSSLISTDGGTT